VIIKDFATPTIAAAWAARLRMLEDVWVNRGVFYTFGAATYLDDSLPYKLRAIMYNALMGDYFGLVKEKLDEMFPDCISQHDTMRPSFHIIGSESNGHQASIHTDQGYKKIWGDIDDHLTFTVPIEIPKCGAGLNMLNDETGGVDLIEYEVGKIYIHDGQTTHQIAQMGDIGENENRITLQGHIATVVGVKYMYF